MNRISASSLLLALLAAAEPAVSQEDYCSFRTGLTTAGSSVTEKFGKIIIIGDSLLAGRGNTQGRYETAIAEGLDDTSVVNNARGGNSLDVIANESHACSCDDECVWAVINGGINGHRQRECEETVDQMKELVQRELDAGKKVVIQGYTPDCERNASGEAFDCFLDGYADFAAETPNVWFVDPRDATAFPPEHELIAFPCEDTENLYRANDLSHPSALSGEVMGTKVAEIIRNASQPNETEAPTRNPTPAPTRNPTSGTKSPTLRPTTAAPTNSPAPTSAPKPCRDIATNKFTLAKFGRRKPRPNTHCKWFREVYKNKVIKKKLCLRKVRITRGPKRGRMIRLNLVCRRACMDLGIGNKNLNCV